MAVGTREVSQSETSDTAAHDARSLTNPRVLYIAYWGALEPLGESQLVPAVRRLATGGARITLVTFEKAADVKRDHDSAKVRESLERLGVEWLPLRYHKRPKVPATLFDMVHGVARGLVIRLGHRFDLIHARTFIGGLIGTALSRLLRVPLIFHHEGFYPDEQVDGGVWVSGSRPHRVALALESRIYACCDAVIAMSERGKEVLDRLPAIRGRRVPVVVAPAGPDLTVFPWQPCPRSIEGALRLVYLGSVGYRYKLDAIGRFLVAASMRMPAYLRILSRAPEEEIAQILDAAGASRAQWALAAVPHAAVAAELARQHAGLFFLAAGISEHGCSPTKIGEYWAAGLPVVTTPNAGDTDAIIRRERVGVVLQGHRSDDYVRATDELTTLLADLDLPDRCRRVAETQYSMTVACDRQLSLYRTLTRHAMDAAAPALR